MAASDAAISARRMTAERIEDFSAELRRLAPSVLASATAAKSKTALDTIYGKLKVLIDTMRSDPEFTSDYKEQARVGLPKGVAETLSRAQALVRTTCTVQSSMCSKKLLTKLSEFADAGALMSLGKVLRRLKIQPIVVASTQKALKDSIAAVQSAIESQGLGPAVVAAREAAAVVPPPAAAVSTSTRGRNARGNVVDDLFTRHQPHGIPGHAQTAAAWPAAGWRADWRAAWESAAGETSRDTRSVPSDALASALTDAMEEDFSATMPSEEDMAAVDEAMRALHRTMATAWTSCPFRLAAFGSVATGLAAKGSDVDVVFVGHGGDGAMTADEVRAMRDPKGKRRRSAGDSLPMIAIGRSVRRDRRGDFEEDEYVSFARVPVLKLFYRPREVEMDVTFNSVIGVHNSRLVRAYIDSDPLGRPRRLVTALKAWAKAADVKDSAHDTISSFAHSLLVIFFLQQRGVLPNLQSPGLLKAYGAWRGAPLAPVVVQGFSLHYCGDAAFIRELNNARVRSGRFSTESTGSLLVGFFDYYSRVFDWGRHAVSIRLGRPRERKGWADAVPGRFGIEDPFENQRDLCITMGRHRRMAGQERLIKALVKGREMMAGALPVAAATLGPKPAARLVLSALTTAKK